MRGANGKRSSRYSGKRSGKYRSKLSCRHHTAQRGYAYLALLILIAIIGVTAAATAQLGAIYQRRMAEEELLFVGGEFQRALLSYALATPAGQLPQPHELADLVRDPRYPNPMRHLRKLYADPITGKDDWVLVRSPDGQGIVGIHSASTVHPIKLANFPSEFLGFGKKHSYVDWVFVAQLPMQTLGGRPLSHNP
ncbi:type II secretion system protein [Paraburkholderia fungorum]|uniref:type II secretion system protein n=1 Tax=Paraburkholderia fungorum TaxID=134537 RepID=UPI0038BAC86B